MRRDSDRCTGRGVTQPDRDRDRPTRPGRRVGTSSAAASGGVRDSGRRRPGGPVRQEERADRRDRQAHDAGDGTPPHPPNAPPSTGLPGSLRTSRPLGCVTPNSGTKGQRDTRTEGKGTRGAEEQEAASQGDTGTGEDRGHRKGQGTGGRARRRCRRAASRAGAPPPSPGGRHGEGTPASRRTNGVPAGPAGRPYGTGRGEAGEAGRGGAGPGRAGLTARGTARRSGVARASGHGTPPGPPGPVRSVPPKPREQSPSGDRKSALRAVRRHRRAGAPACKTPSSTHVYAGQRGCHTWSLGESNP
jgi:hypothetical protein